MEDGWSWLKFSTLVLITGVAITGNLLMLLVAVRCKRLRQFQNALIFNMAFADLMQGTLIMPSALIAIYNGSRWMFSLTACKTFATLKIGLTLASVYSLSGISFQRYLFVVKHTRKINSRVSALATVVFVWAVSFLLASTPWYNWGVFGFVPGKEVCTVHFDRDVSHAMTISITGLLLNFIIMLTCYAQIFLTLHRHKKGIANIELQNSPCNQIRSPCSKKRHSIEPPTDVTATDKTTPPSKDKLSLPLSKHSDLTNSTGRRTSSISSMKLRFTHLVSPKEMQLLRTICVVVVVFIGCWAPYCIVNWMYVFRVVTKPIQWLDTVSMWLGFLNSALNPLIYGFVNQQCHRAMVDFIRCRKPDKT